MLGFWPLGVFAIVLVLGSALGWRAFRLARPQQFAGLVASVKQYRSRLDTAAIPTPQSIIARDQTPLFYRFYPQRDPLALCVLVHGSSANGTSMHAAAEALRSGGFAVAALDIRGHGGSGERGHIRYVGQLEDDLKDVLNVLAAQDPGLPIGLIGFSSGGGFVLRIAGTPALSDRFAFFIALSPMISARSSTYRPNAGGWVNVSVARILSIEALNALGIQRFNRTAVLRFGLDDETIALDGSTPAYSYDLQKNFGLPLMFEATVQRIEGRTLVLVGKADTLFNANAYAPELRALNPQIEVETLEGMDHIDMIYHSSALARLVTRAKAMATLVA